jgi:hypothetical protein
MQCSQVQSVDGTNVHGLSATKRWGVARLCVAAAVFVSGPTFAAQKTVAKTEATAEATPSSGGASGMRLSREVEVVVVWGFRLRSQAQEQRIISIRDGYEELVQKDVCLSSICGFVVVQEDSKWRASNVLAGSEQELRDMQQNMEREGTTLVIVHPTGSRRQIPVF